MFVDGLTGSQRLLPTHRVWVPALAETNEGHFFRCAAPYAGGTKQITALDSILHFTRDLRWTRQAQANQLAEQMQFKRTVRSVITTSPTRYTDGYSRGVDATRDCRGPERAGHADGAARAAIRD